MYYLCKYIFGTFERGIVNISFYRRVFGFFF